jgi:hypothetical protein
MIFKDRVKETTTTTGTGTLTLGGAVAGFQSFSAIGDGGQCYACAYSVDENGLPNGDWEVFIGTYSASGTQLARTTILSSSNGGAAVNFSSGTKHVILGVAAVAILTALLSNPVVFDNSLCTEGFPPASDQELVLSLNAANANVLALRNTNTEGLSAITARSHDNYEKFAAGWGNSSADAFFRNCTYIESWPGTLSEADAPEFFVTMDYGTGGGLTKYKRLRCKSDKSVEIPKVAAGETNPDAAFGVDPNNNVFVGSTIATDATDGFFRVPSCAGAPTGAAADGSLVRDSVNHKLYLRSGGNWIALN